VPIGRSVARLAVPPADALNTDEDALTEAIILQAGQYEIPQRQRLSIGGC
jgi:hypothetical protein